MAVKGCRINFIFLYPPLPGHWISYRFLLAWESDLRSVIVRFIIYLEMLYFLTGKCQVFRLSNVFEVKLKEAKNPCFMLMRRYVASRYDIMLPSNKQSCDVTITLYFSSQMFKMG